MYKLDNGHRDIFQPSVAVAALAEVAPVVDAALVGLRGRGSFLCAFASHIARIALARVCALQSSQCSTRQINESEVFERVT